MRRLDDVSLRILEALQDDARISSAELARRLGMAQSAIHDRMRKLEREGLIGGYTARLAAEPLGLGLIAFVLVRTDGNRQAREVARELAAIEEVQEVHHVAGEDCLLAKVRVPDTDALWQLARERLDAIESITGTRTTIVLETVKETSDLPLGRVPAGRPRRRGDER